MKGLLDLTQKAAVLRGAAEGIGPAQILALAEYGADVVLAGPEPATLERLADQIRALGRKTLCIEVDLSQEDSVLPMVTA